MISGDCRWQRNTNFFISLEQGEFVLTLVERGPVAEMPFFIELLDVLHDADLPVPYALRTTDSIALRELRANRPCCNRAWRASTSRRPMRSIVPRWRTARPPAPGHPRRKVLERKTDRGLEWMLSEGAQLISHLNEAQQCLLRDALAEIEAHKADILGLPRMCTPICFAITRCLKART